MKKLSEVRPTEVFVSQNINYKDIEEIFTQHDKSLREWAKECIRELQKTHIKGSIEPFRLAYDHNFNEIKIIMEMFELSEEDLRE